MREAITSTELRQVPNWRFIGSSLLIALPVSVAFWTGIIWVATAVWRWM